MPLHVAFQMDSIESIDINADTTFRLMEEAQARGHQLFYYLPDMLSYQQGRITARGCPITLHRKQGAHFVLGDMQEVDLAKQDVIWLRQDPPFDMNYITTTHILQMLGEKTVVVNDPFWVRNFPEKLLVLQFPDLTVPTTIARDLATIKQFKKEYGDIILKPLYGNGGAGVFRLSDTDQNLNALHEMFCATSREPMIVQKFLKDVTFGDKRIILVNGEPIGAINRIPQKGEVRSNMHIGGVAHKDGLTERDYEICRAIGPLLREKRQVLVGIDVIGGFLTEINVTSPTGIQEIERFDGINIAEAVWQAVEGIVVNGE